MKEQESLKKQKTKSNYNIEIFVIAMLEVIILVVVGFMIFKTDNKTNNNDNKQNSKDNISNTFYNVNLYGYYESDKEDESVKNFYETKVDYLTTIKVREYDSLYNTLKNLVSECPGNPNFCEEPNIIDAFSSGAFIYNDFVKNEIQKENESLKEYWKCYNSSKTETEKNLCEFNYFFDEKSSKYKYSLKTRVICDVDILIIKQAFDKIDIDKEDCLKNLLSGFITSEKIIPKEVDLKDIIGIDKSNVEYSKVKITDNGLIYVIIKTDDNSIINTLDMYFNLNYKGYQKSNFDEYLIYVYNGNNDYNLNEELSVCNK